MSSSSKKSSDASDKTINRQMNGKEFAALVGVTKTTVTNWADDGMPCGRTARSGTAIAVDLRRALPWLIKRRVAKEAPARVGVAHEQAERLRIQNKKARGELLDAHLVEEGLKAATAALLQDWDAVAQRCTSDGQLQTIIATELRAAQQRFADALAKIADDFAAQAQSAEHSDDD
jgi:phage terminase Nu1 subunit (DNA packaging protein)